MFTQRQPYASQDELDAQRGMMPSDPAATTPDTGAAPESMGMVPRDPEIAPRPGETEPTDKVELFKGNPVAEPDAPQTELTKRRHQILMDCLQEESERQAEERQQAQIDDDYYHHQQWTHEEARILKERGQAPLVFNEARAAIDWLTGTERRLRKDYKIRPRSKEDEAGAELKTKVFKYTEDVNLAPWRRSGAFKQCVTSGLGWLEEGISLDPERELIYAGSEDWRRIYRDSRGREFDQSDCRYNIRRKVIDLDYAQALLPSMSQHLAAIAGRWGTQDEETDDVWYLGERLTSAHAQAWATGAGVFGEDYTVRRSASAWDFGRRNSVELLETWYRVPQTVKVFAAGPQFRKIVNPADPGHQQLLNDRWACYETVKMQMRCMVGTKYQPGWDGPSPFRHSRFPFIPMWGYRRGRDGLAYGSMRGMRDPQDDLNKRRSKALFALSAQRTFVKSGAVEDVEELRAEIARVDAMVVIDGDINTGIRVEESMKMDQVRGNLELAQANIEHIRNAGGVTGESLGHDTNAQSGKAIIAKQDQGSLVTYELFDNYYLAFRLAGQIRMSNIEQFHNQEWTLRIDPQGKQPATWVTVNQYDPSTGRYLNDITAAEADFIVDSQDYRASLTQAAMQSMFELLQQMAPMAPQVVLALLDLVVDSADVQDKDEWVARIRKLNGQRDPSKPPTPEEMAQQQQQDAKQQQLDQINTETAQAQLDVLKSKINDTNAASVLKNIQGLLASVQAAVAVTSMPGAAAPADGIAKSAGFVDKTPNDPLVTAGVAPPQPQPVMPGAAPVPPGGDAAAPAPVQNDPTNPQGPALSAPSAQPAMA